MCANLRRAARAITQMYDIVLRPHGLRVTQFTVLQALGLARELSQGELAALLAMDSTSLTRTLEILRRHGWVTKSHGKDRRERRLQLTQSGTYRLRRALPYWKKAQKSLGHRLGDARWRSLLKLSHEVASQLPIKGGD
jgi:DNA-binding MarR family transcriptional regulator